MKQSGTNETARSNWNLVSLLWAYSHKNIRHIGVLTLINHQVAGFNKMGQRTGIIVVYM